MYKFLYKGKFGFSDRDGIILYNPQFENVYKVSNGWACILSNKWFVYTSSETVLISKDTPSYYSKSINTVFSEANTAINYEEKKFNEWVFLDDNGSKISDNNLGYIEPFHFGLAISFNIEDCAQNQLLINEKGAVKFDIGYFKQMIKSEFKSYFFERYLYNLIGLVTIDENKKMVEYLFEYTSNFNFKLIKSGGYTSDKSFKYNYPKGVPFHTKL